jgi:chaperonin GroEL (HSP60 family)
VPCGGVALLQASSAVSISDNGASVDGSEDERTGARIVPRAFAEPLRQLAENAGLEGSVVVNDVRKAKKGEATAAISRLGGRFRSYPAPVQDNCGMLTSGKHCPPLS